MSLVEVFDENKVELSTLSYMITQLEWHVFGFFSNKDRVDSIRHLYMTYVGVKEYYLDLKNRVRNLDEYWTEYYELSMQFLYCNNYYMDSESPKIKFKKIEKSLGILIGLHKIQRLYKNKYKIKLKCAKKIQRNWKACRYNPKYNMCSTIQIRQLKDLFR